MRKVMLTFIFPLITIANTPSFEEISKKRQELEILSQELVTLQKKGSADIDVLIEKRKELLNQSEELKNKKQELLKVKSELIKKTPKSNAKIDIKNWIAFIDSLLEQRKSFSQRSPLLAKESLKSLQQVKEGLGNPKESIESTINLFLTALEKDFKKAKTIRYSIEDIQIGDSVKSAELAIFGNLFMYFKASDDTTGIFYRKNDHWKYHIAIDSEPKKLISNAILRVKSNDRNGYIEELILPTEFLN